MSLSHPTSPPSHRQEAQESSQEEKLFDPNGTDLTQVRAMLAMTPIQRVRYVQSLARRLVRMRHGLRRIS